MPLPAALVERPLLRISRNTRWRPTDVINKRAAWAHLHAERQIDRRVES